MLDIAWAMFTRSEQPDERLISMASDSEIRDYSIGISDERQPSVMASDKELLDLFEHIGGTTGLWYGYPDVRLFILGSLEGCPHSLKEWWGDYMIIDSLFKQGVISFTSGDREQYFYNAAYFTNQCPYCGLCKPRFCQQHLNKCNITCKYNPAHESTAPRFYEVIKPGDPDNGILFNAEYYDFDSDPLYPQFAEKGLIPLGKELV